MRTISKLTSCVVALTVMTGGAALAADQTILGTVFGVKDRLPGVNPSKRKIVVGAKEKESPNSLVGDPLADGATIEIIANGGSPSSQTFVLPGGEFVKPPAAGWKGKSHDGRASFKYIDKHGTNGPVKLVRIKAASGRVQIKVVVDGKNGTIDVLPPNPGTDGGMILTINNGDSYCVAFGGAAGGKIGNRDDQTFKVVRPTGEDCPVAQ